MLPTSRAATAALASILGFSAIACAAGAKDAAEESGAETGGAGEGSGGGDSDPTDSGESVDSAHDLDQDGWEDAEDCNDTDPAVNPGATEVCNGVDDDCDGAIDPDDAQGSSTSYADNDGDGYGDDTRSYRGCDPPAGNVSRGGDCDDRNPARNPGADEVCDEAEEDEDCDGLSDFDDPSMVGDCGYERLTGSWTILVVCENVVTGVPDGGRDCPDCNFSFETQAESNTCGVPLGGTFGYRASDSTVHANIDGLGDPGPLPAVLTRGGSYDTLRFEGGSGSSAISGEFRLY